MRTLTGASLAIGLSLAPSVAFSQATEAPPPKPKPAVAPDKVNPATAAKPSGGSGIVVYVVCAPITALIGIPVGPTAEVKIDGKVAGEVASCSSRRFPTAPGEREVSVRQSGFGFFDLGFAGPKYPVASGKTTYVRAHFYKYFETSVVQAERAQAEIAAMPKSK